MTRAPLAQVLERHASELMHLPGVIGVGEGESEGQPAIVVFVEQRTTEIAARLPKQIEGYAVVLRETGEVKAQPR